MKRSDIKSIDDLRLRKAVVKREIEICEDQLATDYYIFTSPVANIVRFVKRREEEKIISNSGFYKFVSSARKVANIFQIGFSLYSNYKRR